MQTPDQNSGTYCPLVYVKPNVSLPFVYKPFSGFVIVKIKINKNGVTENQIVVESTHRSIERSAVRAAQKLKFRPYIVDEKVVEIQNYYFKFNIQY
jgi:TonB family protein